MGEIWQFWSRQISIVVASGIATIAVWALEPGLLTSIPRDGFEALSTSFATLLGLTFTAFSLLSTFMPALRRDFVESRTFLTMGETFVVGMLAQMTTFVTATTAFVLYKPWFTEWAGPAVAFSGLVSVGLMAELVAYMLSTFRMARKSF